ncbi:MAG: GAF domain-containing protein, partial [Anaerolineae bacterium]|nr:GAF domain-containing protein [Anaerolineae bacterium]
MAEEYGMGCPQEAAALLLARPDGALLWEMGREDFGRSQLQTVARQMAALGPSTAETLVAAPTPLESPRGNTWALPLAVGLPGEGEKGTAQGILILLYDIPRWVAPHMEVVTTYGQAGFWLLDEAGRVLLAHRLPSQGEVGERWDLHPLPQEIATAATTRLQRGSLRRQEFRTGGQLVAAVQLLWAGREWWLLSATPRESIVAPARVSYHHMTRLFLVVSILFFLVASSTIHVYRAFSTALHRQARERTREVAALIQVSRTLAEAQDLESVLDAVLEQAIALVGKASGSVMLIDQARKTLRIVAHRGLSPEVVQEFNERPVYIWEGTFAEVVRTGKPLEVPDAWSDPRVLHEVGEVPPSLTNLPLKAGDRVIGIVAVDAVPPDDMARRLLQALADVASVAILRAQLYESERAKHQLALTLQDTARLFNSEMDVERLLDLILEQLERVVHYERAAILLQEHDKLRPTAVRGKAVQPEFARFLLRAKSLHHSQQVFRTGKPLLVSDVRNDPHWIPATPDDPVRCWMGSPLVHKGQRLGVLFVASDRPEAYDAAEMEVLAAFAAHAAVAIANARLYAEATNRARELQSLQEITRAIAATLAPESMYRIVTHQAGNLVPNAWCGLARYLPEQGGFVLEAVSTHVETLLEQGLALPAGEPPFAPLVEGASSYRSAPNAQATGWMEEALAFAGVHSLLALPLRVEDDLMGALVVASQEPGGFSPDHEATLGELTTHLALAVRNAELLASRQQALDELRAVQEQLVRTEKLRALGRMASGIAHNFNNTLAVILGRAQLAQRRTGDPELQADLQAIVRAAQDGASTVRRLREYTRMEPVPPGPVSTNLNEVVRTVVDVTRPRWKDEPEREGRPVQVVVEEGDVPPVPADASELREVLTNMIFNAVDAMPSGGTITLRTRQDGDWAVVEVQDTGIGMSEEVRRRVFDPFFTTKGPASTGLGLSTSYGIVRRHGGNIEVQSMLGKGTTLTIRLPTVAAAPAEAPAPEPVVPATRSGHILVVDDDPEVRETLSRVLALGD